MKLFTRYLKLKDRKVSDPKVMLKLELLKKKSISLKFLNVGIGRVPAQTPILAKCITLKK